MIGMLLVALAASLWGTIGVAVDMLYRVSATDPISVGFLRMAIASPALLALSRTVAGPGFLRVARQDTRPVALMAIGFAAYQVCYFSAIPHIGVAAAVMVNICSAPIIISILSALVLRERVSRRLGAVLVAAVVGAALLVSGSPEAAEGRSLWLGTGLALGAGFAYSVVALAARAVASRYSPVQPVAIAFPLGTMMLAPFALDRGLALDYPPLGWLLLLHLGLVPTGVAYVLYLWGLRSTPATVAAIVALLEPLISAVLAVAVLGERLPPTAALGGVILLGSIAMLQRMGSGALPADR